MDSKTLELPPSGATMQAQHVDGMREIVVYDIGWDGFRGRWDTIIDGRQTYVVGHSLSQGERLEHFIERFRPIAKAYFEAQEKA